MSNNYQSVFGFTIGPIYEMMSHSQKTRELWFSSFFFSWYVKRLYQNLEDEKCFTFLTPYYAPGSMGEKTKAGLFPDHIIAQSEKSVDEIYNLLKVIIRGVGTEFINMIDELGKSKYLINKDKNDVEKIFTDYIQTSFVVFPADKMPDNKKIIETIDTYLDALERNRSFTLGKKESTCYRCKSLPSIFIHTIEITLASGKRKKKEEKLCPFCFLKYECHRSEVVKNEVGITEENEFRYPSTGEISAFELLQKIKKEDLEVYIKKWEEIEFDKSRDGGKEFRKLLPKKGKEVQPYHKYMAIVQADGDNLGDTANKLGNPRELSQLLFDFGKTAYNITKEFHGEPIYIGGDDVMSFMPTAFSERDNFFTVIDYIQKLSKAYKCKMNEKDLPGSISFGVNLFYYKSPLSLAVKEARDQLNYISKKIPGKDSLALLLTQHSGQKAGLKFRFFSPELELFNNILKNIRTGTAEFPHGIHHKLDLYKRVLINLSRIEQIEHFFANRFNEEIHESFKGLPGLQKLLVNMLTVSSASGTLLLKGDDANNRFNEFISMIRFIKFLIGEDK